MHPAGAQKQTAHLSKFIRGPRADPDFESLPQSHTIGQAHRSFGRKELLSLTTHPEKADCRSRPESAADGVTGCRVFSHCSLTAVKHMVSLSPRGREEATHRGNFHSVDL